MKLCGHGQASPTYYIIIHLSSERKKKGSTDKTPFTLLLFLSESGGSWPSDMTHVR